MKNTAIISVLFCLFLLFASCASSPSKSAPTENASSEKAGTNNPAPVSEMTQEQLDKELSDIMYYPSRSDNKERIAALLKAGANPNQERVTNNIKYLIMHGDLETAKLLFNSGVDPNFRDKDGRTLAYTVSFEYSMPRRRIDNLIEKVEFMISCGVRFDTIDNNGNSPLMFRARESIDGGIEDVLHLILDWEKKYSPRFAGSYNNRNTYLTEVLKRYFIRGIRPERSFDTPFIERLLNEGANPAAREKGGRLMVFRDEAYYGIHYESLPLFIERGIPLNETDKYGSYLLSYAISNDKTGDLIKMLLKHGANPNIRNGDGQTPLMYAKSIEIVEALLIHGADPSLKDKNGNTALHYCAEGNIYTGIVSGDRTLNYLLGYGCPIDIANNEGQTPLMLAIKRGRNFDDIFYMIEKGADVTLKDNNGNNMFYYLAVSAYNRADYNSFPQRFEYIKLTRVLLDKGVSPAEKNNDDVSALTFLFQVSKRDNGKQLKPLRDIFTDNATEEEIRIAKAGVEEKEKTRLISGSFTKDVLPFLILPAASIAAFAAYSGNPEANFMGPVNSVLAFTAIGGAIGSTITFFLFLPEFFWPGHTVSDGLTHGIIASFVGGFIWGVVATSTNSYIRRSFATNPALYFAPSAISLIVMTFNF